MICNAQFLKKKWRIGYVNNEVFIIRVLPHVLLLKLIN